MQQPDLPVADALLSSLSQLTNDDDDDKNPLNKSNHSFQSGPLFARLKAFHRAANAAIRANKQTTAEARLAMDQAHLQLQNLLYERRHLEREIEKCNRFASIYQDIPMHTLDEFKQQANPDSVTDDLLLNEHQLMLSRLTFELAERQRLEEQRKSLASDKEARMKEYRDLEKLVSEWFTQGTGIELAIADLKKMGNNVATKLGVSSPPSKEPSPNAPAASHSDQMEVDPQPQRTSSPQIPSGPRIRS